MLEKDIRFNYIITIHDKEYLIRDVMLSVLHVAGENSHIYPVLDGCSDLSESIIDDIIKLYPKNKITKLFADDVHELKSINIGLNSSHQEGEGYNIILQDDVVLLDPEWEKKVIHLYHNFPQLGIVSFRHGGNISRELLLEQSTLDPVVDYIQSECGHYPQLRPILKIGYFIFKEVAIKSPICIPFKIIRELHTPDEVYSPWDDTAYCYKVSAAGYANGVYALNFVSEVFWGTTRNKSQKISVEEVQAKNLELFRKQHPSLPPLDEVKYQDKKYLIFYPGFDTIN